MDVVKSGSEILVVICKRKWLHTVLTGSIWVVRNRRGEGASLKALKNPNVKSMNKNVSKIVGLKYYHMIKVNFSPAWSYFENRLINLDDRLETIIRPT